MSTAGPRVRFAPSPTGYLHIGGVRTALYSWLWARRNGGTFVLRIEDTDRERSTKESIDIVLESMRWLGLNWDEGPDIGGPNGPYMQSQRLALYADYAERLVQNGYAYRCYASKEEIAAAREAHQASGAKIGFRFRSPWRDPKKTAPSANAPHVFRFRAPEQGSTGWVDLVKGRIDVPNDAQQDFILLRQDGMPLYNFGCVIDDMTMGITLVARGDDHVVNTPVQLLLYEALNAKPPQFAHLPMVLAPNGEKLSKRHAAVGVLEYRDMGYLADAVLNYLARLGWSHGDQEIFTRSDLIEKFNWDHVGSTAGRYDGAKFLYVQAEHLRALPHEELAKRVVPFLAQRGVNVTDNDEKLLKAIPYVKTRVSTLVEFAEAMDFFYKDVAMDPQLQAKFLTPDNLPYLSRLAEAIANVEPFTHEALDTTVRQWLERENLKMKQVAQPSRIALTGRAQSPGLFEVMEVLGKQETLRRLQNAAQV